MQVAVEYNMADLPAQSSPERQGRHLVLYDGVCGLCNRLLHFLVRRDIRGVFAYASLQSATGRAAVERTGGNPDDLTSFYVVADFQSPRARVLTRSDAAVFVAGQLGWPWRIMRAGGALPKPIRDAMYNVVARTRYRIFGRYETCPLIPAELRSRFIE
jgi:predicted DCC family thiol-disulfide oxidoreductase YuxK